MKFEQHQLDNGLQIIAECNPQAYSMAVGFFVDAGSRDEADPIAGVSHFLEHMTFKGTARRTAFEINREMDEIGSQSNAYTSEEQTVYYMAVVPEYQDHAVDLLTDMMRPALRDEDFDVEKKVIIEEICKYDDQPPFGAHEKAMAAFFGTHPLGNSVLGTADSVGALSSSQMREYFESRYSPNNMTLVASGKVDFERLVKQAEKACGGWSPSDVERVRPAYSGQQQTHWIEREQAHQEYIIQIADGPHADDSQRYAHRLLTTIYGDDGGSRLFWELVDTGDAEYAASASYEFQAAGISMTYVSCAPEDVQEILQRLDGIQRRLADEGVTEDELELARSKVCSQIVRRAERPFNRLFAVGLNWLQRNEYTTVGDVVKRYQEVRLEDLQESAKRFPFFGGATVLAGPAKP